jgi:hypothetical protein
MTAIEKTVDMHISQDAFRRAPMPATFSTHWDSDRRTLFTRFSGIPDATDVERWKTGLWDAVRAMPQGCAFKTLIDLSGYSVDAVPRDVHFAQRTVIPEFLAAHNFKIGYLKMYAEPVALHPGAGNRNCVATAHVHHECYKMEFYREKFGEARDGYFCDAAEADHWLRQA